MGACGCDCGTYNLVVARRAEDGSFIHKKEVNAFLEMPISEDRYVFNMMQKAGVPLIEHEDGTAYALGEAAVSMAYAMTQIELKRPMKDGCLNPKERNAQRIMASMINGLLDGVEPGSTLYYSVPSNAINVETDADYHAKVLEAIFSMAENENGEPLNLNHHSINEGLALVYAELADKAWTGIGVSLGSGMVNLCYAIMGAPVFKFSLVNSGDWIDKMASKALGEDTTSYVNREKLNVDLSANQPELVYRAVKAQYEIMIQKTVAGIKKGFESAGNKARTEKPVDIIISGGTSSPKGFPEMFRSILDKTNLPIKVDRVIRPKDPLYSVARGCLIAAENAK